MKKLCCIIYAKYRKFEKLEKTLVISIICSKYKNENEKKKNNGDISNSWFNWKYIITLIKKCRWKKSRKHQKICTTLNYIKHFLISASTITQIGLNICAIMAGSKTYEPIIMKKKHDEIVLLAKSKSKIVFKDLVMISLFK